MHGLVACLSGMSLLFRYKPGEIIQLDKLAETDRVLNPGGAGTQVYEEIREPETETAAQTATPNLAAPTAVPQYEDVLPARKVPESSDPYHITPCAAYGLPH